MDLGIICCHHSQWPPLTYFPLSPERLGLESQKGRCYGRSSSEEFWDIGGHCRYQKCLLCTPRSLLFRGLPATYSERHQEVELADGGGRTDG